MSISDLFSDMKAAGCTIEQIESVVRAQESRDKAADEARRFRARVGNRERQARFRSVHNESNAVTDVNNALSDVLERDERDAVSPKVSPKENQNPFLPPSVVCETRGSVQADFEEFYEAYPKRENRKGAFARYEAIRRSGVTHARIMAGEKRWLTKWTAERTEKQYIPAPDVWLNKAKYDDEVLPDARAGPASPMSAQSRNHGAQDVQTSRSASAAANALKERLRLANSSKNGGNPELPA